MEGSEWRRRAVDLIEELSTRDAEEGRHAEGLGTLRRDERGRVHAGVLMGGRRLHRHSGDPEPARGMVEIEIGRAEQNVQGMIVTEADAVVRWLRQGVAARPVPAKAREWGPIDIDGGPEGRLVLDGATLAQALQVVDADLEGDRNTNYVPDGATIGARAGDAAATLTAMRRGALSQMRMTTVGVVEGEWTNGPKEPPEDPWMCNLWEVVATREALRALGTVLKRWPRGDVEVTQRERRIVTFQMDVGVRVIGRVGRSTLTVEWRSLMNAAQRAKVKVAGTAQEVMGEAGASAEADSDHVKAWLNRTRRGLRPEEKCELGDAEDGRVVIRQGDAIWICATR